MFINKYDLPAPTFDDDIDRRMSVIVFRPAQIRENRVAIVSHGLKAAATAPHISKIIQAYLDNQYTVIAPDLCNSDFNNSGGRTETFRIKDHIRDIRRTIDWADNHKDILSWNDNRFVMAGHSMGSYASCFLAATAYSDRCRHLLSISSTTSGTRSLAARANKAWHPQGLEILRRETPLLEKEWPDHDIYKHVQRLTMPISLIVGADDTLTPPSDIDDFFNALPNGIEKKIIPGEHHCLIGKNIPHLLSGMIKTLDMAAPPKRPHTPSLQNN